MGFIEDLNIEITFYNRDIKVYRTVVNLLVPDFFNTIEAFFLDDHDNQNLYTKMEIKYNGRVVLERDVKARGISVYG